MDFRKCCNEWLGGSEGKLCTGGIAGGSVLQARIERAFMAGTKAATAAISELEQKLQAALTGLEEVPQTETAIDKPQFRIFKDGDAFFCVGPDFVDLQSSTAGIGDTAEAALKDYIKITTEITSSEEVESLDVKQS